jgi:hypothetical protein
VAGVMETEAGVFVPYDPALRPAYGFVVPRSFWDYITRADLFPGGWLHDIGLPMTDAFHVRAFKNGVVRELTVQAFERTVLTNDLLNPLDWQIERGNIGADAVRLLPPPNAIEIPAPGARVTLPLLDQLVRVVLDQAAGHLLRIQTSQRICVLLSDHLMRFQCVPLVHCPLLG